VAEHGHRSDGGRGPSAVASVVLPVALLLIVIAILAGLVLGGVVQGHAPRTGPGPSTTTESTIVIEP
jgi:hypothetical protein